jgi:hypothetical protein
LSFPHPPNKNISPSNPTAKKHKAVDKRGLYKKFTFYGWKRSERKLKVS